MDEETLAEKLYNVMMDKMAEIEPSTKDEMNSWAEAEEDGKQLFRAMASFVIGEVKEWTNPT